MKRANPSSVSNLLTGPQRLNKLLAAAGLGSRRQVDELIEQGRVEIDGAVCEELGTKVDAEVAKITVDGVALKKIRPVYYALNKPAGVLCTNRDPQGRRRAIDFIPDQHRLFPVGRLDASSVGLLLLTNDGELTQQLTHPKHGVPKTYHVVVAGQMDPKEIRRLRRGIHLSEGIARVEFVKIRHIRKNSTELEITLCEGKNREIRRVLARIGHKVVTLRRLSIGPLKLGNLPEAAYRPLSKDEIAALYRAAQDARSRKRTERSDRTSESKTRPVPKTEKDRPRPSKSKTPIDEKQASRPPRDPFAWDDDDELLTASSFPDLPRLDGLDDADDDNDNDFPSIDIEDEEDSASSPNSIGGDAILVDDRGGGMRVGSVMDYEPGEKNSKSPRHGREKAPDSKRKSTKKKSGFEKRGSSERSGPRKGSKKGVGVKKSGFKKGGFKKGGFKKGGFKKGPFKKGSEKRGDVRASGPTKSKSSHRGKKKR